MRQYPMMVEKSTFLQILVLLLCALLLAYFGYHAVSGRFGLEARGMLSHKSQKLVLQLGRLETTRLQLERDVSALYDDKLSTDLLGEYATTYLSFSHPDDVILVRSKAQ